MGKVNTETHVVGVLRRATVKCSTLMRPSVSQRWTCPWRRKWSAGAVGHREQERRVRVYTTTTHYTHKGNCQNLQRRQNISIESCTWLQIIFLKKKARWNWGSKGKPIRVDMTITNRNDGCEDIWLSLFLPFLHFSPFLPHFAFSHLYFTSEYY